MQFIIVERSHVGNLVSMVQSQWHDISKFTWKQKAAKMAANKPVSLAGGAATSAITGAMIGIVGGPLGVVIGAVAGALIGVNVGLISVASGAIIDQLSHKYNRRKISDRLDKSSYREKSGKTSGGDVKDKDKRKGHWYEVEHPITMSQLRRQYDDLFWKIWYHKENKELIAWLKQESGPVSASGFPIPAGKKVWIPFKPQNVSIRLQRVVKESLRDSVVHLRNTISIYQEMVDEGAFMTGGIYYTTGKDETIDDVVANVTNMHSKTETKLLVFKKKKHFDFIPADISKHPKNEPGRWLELATGDSLNKIASDENRRVMDILHHDENDQLRTFYVFKELDPNVSANRDRPLDGVGKVYLPPFIPPKRTSIRNEVIAHGKDVKIVRNTQVNYLPTGTTVWVPVSGASLVGSEAKEGNVFDTCDFMIDMCDDAFWYIHHLNKFRNYLLPSLNLARIYLDVFDELNDNLEHARADVEDAVLDFMQRGEHKGCRMEHQWKNVLYFKTKKQSPVLAFVESLAETFFGGFTTDPSHRRCMRSMLKRTTLRAGEPEDYTVEKDNQTFEEIASEKGIPAQALTTHNYEMGALEADEVKYDSEKQEFVAKRTGLKKGTKLKVPKPNAIDKLLYSPMWKLIGLTPEGAPEDFSVDYSDNHTARVSIAEVDTDACKKELDEMIDEYYEALSKNSETHKKKWHEAPKDERRYRYFFKDLLNQCDNPDFHTKFDHKIQNTKMKFTTVEKIMWTADSALAVMSEAIGMSLGTVAQVGASAAVPTAKDVGALDVLKAFFSGADFGPKIGKYTLEKTATTGFTVGNTLLGLVVDKGAPKGLGKITKDKDRITRERLLDYRRERALAAQTVSGRKGKKEKASFKRAAKETDELFMKVTKHAYWAHSVLQSKLAPILVRLAKNHDKPGHGIKTCQEAGHYLSVMYEFQHQLDKTGRYIAPCLAFVAQMRDWEKQLSLIEEDIRKVLQDSAGNWIKDGDHSGCVKKRFLKKSTRCYGPSEDKPNVPINPLSSREEKPKVPSKKSRPKKPEK